VLLPKTEFYDSSAGCKKKYSLQHQAEQAKFSGNDSDFYLGGAWFESWIVAQTILTGILWLSSITTSNSDHDNFL
jgi:hypothetical protein